MDRVIHTYNRGLWKYLYFININHPSGYPQFESRLCSLSFLVWLSTPTKDLNDNHGATMLWPVEETYSEDKHSCPEPRLTSLHL